MSIETALDDDDQDAFAEAEAQNRLIRKAVKGLMQQYGWDERTAASVMLTVTTFVGLAPKKARTALQGRG